MATYMPPIARKKRVPAKYNPDSFRVISTQAEEQAARSYDSSDFVVSASDKLPGILSPSALPHVVKDFRANKPHPSACSFLRHNAATLNEPVCSVHTFDTHSEQHAWWPSRTSKEPLLEPPYTRDTTFRRDFQFDPQQIPSRALRNTSNPNKVPALGAAPVNFLRESDGKQKLWKENISYEHQYNCRIDPNYPVRAKRYGSFVWHKMTPRSAESFIDYHSKSDGKRAASHRVHGSGGLYIRLPHWLKGPYGEEQPQSSQPPKQQDFNQTQIERPSADVMRETCKTNSEQISTEQQKVVTETTTNTKSPDTQLENDVQLKENNNNSPAPQNVSSPVNGQPSSPKHTTKMTPASASSAHRETVTVNNPELVKSLLTGEPQQDNKEDTYTEE